MAHHHSLTSEEPIEEESYFVSMTDMMVGLLFIFILILMYFALQYQKSTEKLENAENTREKIIQEIVAYLRENNVPVNQDDIDLESGVLHLPEKILEFESGQDKIKVEDEPVVKSLAEALDQTLPCYVSAANTKPDTCKETPHKLESVFIEGHTDNDMFIVNGEDNNWELSTKRAVNMYRMIVKQEPNIDELKNDGGRYLLSVSGYGSRRNIVENSSDENKKRNRRIDLRFIMATPDATEAIKDINHSVIEKIK